MMARANSVGCTIAGSTLANKAGRLSEVVCAPLLDPVAGALRRVTLHIAAIQKN